MPTIAEVTLDGLRWHPGRVARIWFGQPLRSTFGVPPFTPSAPDNTLALFEAMCAAEAQYPPPDSAPTFVALPEMALHPNAIEPLRHRILGARPNTVFVVGLGHLTEAEARSLEPQDDLWNGPSNGHFTNCAVVGIGGSDRLYLQPKIVPSTPEQDTHWRGKVLRCFKGEHLVFAVVICSELIARPEETETLADAFEELSKKTVPLSALFWLQHNKKPRSTAFHASYGHIAAANHVPTTFVISARGVPGKRFENFAVSGAIIPNAALPRQFDKLDSQFRYVEPIVAGVPMSRLVLLRYDADAYLAETHLPKATPTGESGSAQGALFLQCTPFRFVGGSLHANAENTHVAELVTVAGRRAKEARPELVSELDQLQSRLIAAGLPVFLRFLDVALPPRPTSEGDRHAAGELHVEGDFRCDCWPHRRCIDCLADNETSDIVMAFQEVLEAAAYIDKEGLKVEPAWSKDCRTNTKILLDGSWRPVGLVFPYQCNTQELEKALLWGRRTGLKSPYVILSPAHRSVASINAARARASGSLDPSKAERPTLRAIYRDEFVDAIEKGTLRDAMRRTIGEE